MMGSRRANYANSELWVPGIHTGPVNTFPDLVDHVPINEEDIWARTILDRRTIMTGNNFVNRAIVKA
jgi:hypothetical protein